MRLFVFLAILLISACSSVPEDAEARFTCPKIGFVKGSDKTEIKGKDIKVRISDVKGECLLDDGETELDMSLVFESAKKEDVEIAEDINLKYFVSVLMDENKILLKKIFTTQLDFNEVGISREEEDHVIKLPIKDIEDIAKYKIVLGFVREK